MIDKKLSPRAKELTLAMDKRNQAADLVNIFSRFSRFFDTLKR